MPSSSITRKYDVFVSFRGEIRLSFMDHLFAAFQRNGIVAFRDDTMIKKGESLAPELIRAIEGSLVYVVVFSKDFASSTWCMRELEMILKCVRDSGKRVFPVFYDVDPSEVRCQKIGNYAEAFANHEERFKHDLDMVQNWRDALTQAANLIGWDMCDKPQYAAIENLVKEILNILGHKFSSLPKDVVGMHSPIEELLNHLLLDSVDDVRVIGISGLGGIGKSTLVSILYGLICHQFDACCFIDDVSQIFRHHGPFGALQQTVRQILREEPLQICNVHDATKLIQSRLCRVRALIILDNVDQGGQLEKLAMDREWLGAGSRMVIVTRDQHILKEYGVDVVYNVPLLNHDDSLQLFCQKAFKRDYNYIMGDVMRDYNLLADSILKYAKGLPLAIKVLGSFLYGLDISEWKSALARLKKSPNKKILDVLRISFDGLEEMEKEIFLDIACFFVGDTVQLVKHVLNSCGFHPDIGLRVLIDKSLITSDVEYEYAKPTVGMHDLLKELGRQIVQDISEKNPRRWSRLWENVMWGNVLQTNMEKNIEAIVLWHHQLPNMEGEISIGETLSQMCHLRLLIVRKMDLLGNLNCLPKALKYVHLHEYPFEYMPSSFHPNHLVDLHLPSSRIKQLWKGKKYLPNLRYMNLSDSKNLIMIPDFSEFPNIEWLNLEGCTKLEHLGSPNDVPRKLVYLNVKDCKNLSSLPNDILGLSSLGYLNISGCSKACRNLNLFSVFKSTIGLPFHSLCELDVSFCNLGKIPDAIGCLHLLERLNLRGNNFEILPSLEKLSKLEYLNLEHCKCLKSLTKLPSPATSEWDLPVFPKDNYSRERGMYIFNCPVLVQKERCSNMVSSWMIQFIREANQQSSSPFSYVDTIIPGSKVPRWFEHQTSGSSRLWIDPSDVMEDNDIIGVAYCAVFPVAPGNRRESLKLTVRFCKVDYGEYGFNVDSPVIFDRDLIMVQSTHMWLIYFPMQSFLNNLSMAGMFPVSFDDLVIDTTMGSTRSEKPVKVMKHGYNWVSKKDLQIMHDRKSLAPEHNFLAI